MSVELGDGEGEMSPEQVTLYLARRGISPLDMDAMAAGLEKALHEEIDAVAHALALADMAKVIEVPPDADVEALIYCARCGHALDACACGSSGGEPGDEAEDERA